MAEQHSFEHLPLLLRYSGPARLRGGGKQSPQTLANKNARQAHSATLSHAAQSLSASWLARREHRAEQGLPFIPQNVPVLLQVDPNLDLDALREKFSFEIVAEQEEGYVIVASEDIQMTPFMEMLNGFAVQVHGSARIAQVHRLFDDPIQTDRLSRLLSDHLLEQWPTIADDQTYIVDIGIACAGTQEIPNFPNRGKRATDAQWAKTVEEWAHARTNAYENWDQLKIEREEQILVFSAFYHAEILHMIDGAEFDAAILPDSFTIRLKIVGKGLKDFVLNYPYIFEVVEPEDIFLPQSQAGQVNAAAQQVAPTAPAETAPAVCIIDSGIQENHVLLQPAIDHPSSVCFLPGIAANDVADYVQPGGHGTRVAGAVLYGEEVAKDGTPQLPYWIQNARVLDADNRMPVDLFPPEVLRKAIQNFHTGVKHTRIFNHSINANGYCRTRYMSSWAAEIDALSNEYDVLVIQSAGNLPISGNVPYLGVKDHLLAGRNYPAYMQELSARVANPGQSLQALTVGSIAYGAFGAAGWTTFAPTDTHPSAFSRSGPGIWSVIKPEVVEYGGDDLRTDNAPADVRDGGGIAAACPELVRSTMYPPGPAYDRDATGTSFSAPKVARIAAQLQLALPNESALLYRGLIVQSARWPTWAEDILTQLRQQGGGLDQPARQLLMQRATKTMSCIGYGIPDGDRAALNTQHRTTLISGSVASLRSGECHIFQVPIPSALRQPADEFEIRIDVTLSYVSQPRRTRRNLRRYLSTWLDWKSSRLGESINDFRARALKDDEIEADEMPGTALPWTLHESVNSGFIRDIRRNSGTVQKDWAVVSSNTLPDHFCISVAGHQGWSRDPDSSARYTLAVTFEILGQEIPIYDPLRTAVLELQAQVEPEIEAEVEIEIE